jgi:hypothetical protein
LDVTQIGVGPRDFVKREAQPELTNPAWNHVAESRNAGAGTTLLHAGPIVAWGELQTWTLGASLGVSYAAKEALLGFRVALNLGQGTLRLSDANVRHRRALLDVGWCPRLTGGTWFYGLCLGPEVGLYSVRTTAKKNFDASPARYGAYATARLSLVLFQLQRFGLGMRVTATAVAPLIRNVFVIEASNGSAAQNIGHTWIMPGIQTELDYAF